MRGHLQQRGDDAWRLKVYVGRSADGKRRYLERTVHGNRREAERELALLVVEVDEGRHVALERRRRRPSCTNLARSEGFEPPTF